MEVDETGQNLNIPCYVLESTKPLWKGRAVLLGTNALVDYGFGVSHANGLTIQPTSKSQSKDVTMLHVMSSQGVHLKPGHTKWVNVTVSTDNDTTPSMNCGMIVPNEEVLSVKQVISRKGCGTEVKTLRYQ